MSFDEFYQIVLDRHPSIAMNSTTTLTRENFRKAMKVAFDAGFESCAERKKASAKIPEFFMDLMRGRGKC